jgi:hypothetical protein
MAKLEDGEDDFHNIDNKINKMRSAYDNTEYKKSRKIKNSTPNTHKPQQNTLNLPPLPKSNSAHKQHRAGPAHSKNTMYFPNLSNQAQPNLFKPAQSNPALKRTTLGSEPHSAAGVEISDFSNRLAEFLPSIRKPSLDTNDSSFLPPNLQLAHAESNPNFNQPQNVQAENKQNEDISDSDFVEPVLFMAEPQKEKEKDGLFQKTGKRKAAHKDGIYFPSVGMQIHGKKQKKKKQRKKSKKAGARAQGAEEAGGNVEMEQDPVDEFRSEDPVDPDYSADAEKTLEEKRNIYKQIIQPDDL